MLNRVSLGIESVLPFARSIDDSLIALAADHSEAQGRPVSCRAGCAACCHQSVPVTPLEAFALLETVEAMPAAEREVIEARFARVAQQIEEAGLGPTLDWNEREDASRARRAYITAWIACPLLKDDGLCGIYEERPFACREHLVTSDPEHCSEQNRGTVVTVVPLVAHLGQVVAGAAAESWPDIPKRMPLTRALSWARENQELRAVKPPGTSIIGTFFKMLEEG